MLLELMRMHQRHLQVDAGCSGGFVDKTLSVARRLSAGCGRMCGCCPATMAWCAEHLQAGSLCLFCSYKLRAVLPGICPATTCSSCQHCARCCKKRHRRSEYSTLRGSARCDRGWSLLDDKRSEHQKNCQSSSPHYTGAAHTHYC